MPVDTHNKRGGIRRRNGFDFFDCDKVDCYINIGLVVIIVKINHGFVDADRPTAAFRRNPHIAAPRMGFVLDSFTVNLNNSTGNIKVRQRNYIAVVKDPVFPLIKRGTVRFPD